MSTGCPPICRESKRNSMSAKPCCQLRFEVRDSLDTSRSQRVLNRLLGKVQQDLLLSRLTIGQAYGFLEVLN
jgi:hypothetical protein